MGPPAQVLSPSRVDLHRDGEIVVHFDTPLTDNTTVSLPVPHKHARAALAFVQATDSRGGAVSKQITLPGETSRFDGAPVLLRWLAAHTGSHVQLRNESDAPWALNGTLIGVESAPDSNPYSYPDSDSGSDKDEVDTLQKKPPFTVFVRCAEGAIEARTVVNPADLLVRSADSDPDAAIAATVSSAAAPDAIAHLVLHACGAGDGTLSASYSISISTDALFNFQYRVDASPIPASSRATADPRAASVQCEVLLENPLPFDLSGASVRLFDHIAPRKSRKTTWDDHKQRKSVRDNKRSDVDFYSDSEPDSVSSDDEAQDRGTDEGMGKGKPFDYTTIPLSWPTEQARETRETTVWELPRDALAPTGTTTQCVVRTASVQVSHAQVAADYLTRAMPAVKLYNTSDKCLEQGSWCVQYGPFDPATVSIPPLRPGDSFIMFKFQPATVDVDREFLGKRGVERVVGMRGWRLLSQVERTRIVQTHFFNKGEHAEDMMFMTEYQAESHLRGSESATMFVDGDTGPGCELKAVQDAQRGFLTYAFRLNGYAQCAVVARQSYTSMSEHDVRLITNNKLADRLQRDGVPATVVECLRAVVCMRRNVRSHRMRWKAIRHQLSMSKMRAGDLRVDLSDNEDGEAVDRYLAEVERSASCVERLQDAADRAWNKLEEAKVAFRASVESLRVVAQPEILGEHS